jgi:hypothetical protein
MLLVSSGVVSARENPLKNANTHAHDDVHVVVLAHLQRRRSWRCFGENLSHKRGVMALGLEFCIDPLCFGSNIHVGCVAL